MVFPAIDGVKQAFLGLVKCKDFVSILLDSDDNMLTNIFEDNVRDFQGYNVVNTEIRETLNGAISRTYKKFKFHIICVMRTLITGSTVVFGQARKQQKICKKLWLVMQDNLEMDRVLHAAITCVESACRSCDNVPISDQHRSREITISMIGYAEKQAKAVECSSFLKTGDIVHCTVTAMNQSFVNVAIKTEDARNYGSIHISQLAKKYINDIKDEMTIGQIFQAKIIGEAFDEKWGWELSKLF